jgi:DNA/RNA endonuclease YhcR with UshA esterase domain
MKKIGYVLLGIAFVVVLGRAQEQRVNAVPAYDSSQERIFNGTIEEIKNFQCPVSGTIGSHLYIKDGSDVLEVHLAPTTFLKQYAMVLQAGDKVKITGVKFMFDGKPAILARTVVDGFSTFTFRNDKGQPQW